MNGLDDMAGPASARDQAIAWLVRVQSDSAGADDWAALTDWLEADPSHLAAFEEAEQLSMALGEAAPAIAAALDDLSQAQTSPNVVTLRRRRPVQTRTWQGIAAMTAAALALIAGPLTWQAARGPLVRYQTAPGETRTVTLADGSRIQMDGGSRLAVRMGWRGRRVEMADAAASFDVVHDPSRPFIVSVGDQRVRDVGTQFNISHFNGQVVVTVRRGVVQVSQAGRSATPPALLTAGQELRHIEGAAGSTVSRVDPAVAFAWTQNRLICSDQPLAEIVVALNRHYAKPIRLSPAAAAKRFTGVLELGDQKVLVGRLAAYLSLSVEGSDHDIVLR